MSGFPIADPADHENWDILLRGIKSDKFLCQNTAKATLLTATGTTLGAGSTNLFSFRLRLGESSRVLLVSQVRFDMTTVATWSYTYFARSVGPPELLPFKGNGGLVDMGASAVPRFGISVNWDIVHLRDGDYTLVVGANASGGGPTWNAAESWAGYVTLPL